MGRASWVMTIAALVLVVVLTVDLWSPPREDVDRPTAGGGDTAAADADVAPSRAEQELVWEAEVHAAIVTHIIAELPDTWGDGSPMLVLVEPETWIPNRAVMGIIERTYGGRLTMSRARLDRFLEVNASSHAVSSDLPERVGLDWVHLDARAHEIRTSSQGGPAYVSMSLSSVAFDEDGATAVVATGWSPIGGRDIHRLVWDGDTWHVAQTLMITTH